MKPKYLILVEKLERAIETMEKNQMIPSERDLATSYNLSRMTVRKAIDFLVSKNKLYRVNKVGTFTSDEHLYKKADSFSGFSNEVKKTGSSPSNQLIEYTLQSADAFIAGKLNIKEGDLVYKVSRLRLKNNVPIMIDEAHFPKNLIPLNEDIIKDSIYDYIKDTLRLDIKYATQTYHATFPPKKYAKYLNIHENTPIIRTEINAYLKDGRVFEYNKAYINTNRYEIISKSFH